MHVARFNFYRIKKNYQQHEIETVSKFMDNADFVICFYIIHIISCNFYKNITIL